MPALSSRGIAYYTIDVSSPSAGTSASSLQPRLLTKYTFAMAAIAIGLLGIGAWAQHATSLVVSPVATPRIVNAVQPSLRTASKPVDQQNVAASANEVDQGIWPPAAVAATTAVVTLLGPVDAASANLATGRAASLVHPISMFGMLALSLWAGWLGLQWKRARTMGPEITAAKNQAASLASQLQGVKFQTSAKETLAALKSSGQTASASDAQLLDSIAALEQQADDLQAERKALTAGNYRDRHFNAGSLVLALGVASAVIAPVNTYLRTGKLFPGPHLYIGAAMVTIWAVAAGLVPAMQKGNEAARMAHISLNILNTAFFVWQVGTGLEIVGKVLEFTTWP